MTNKLEVEAKLERSLRSGVKAPRLDGRFDASVWSRIEAAEQRATTPLRAAAVAPASARWLFISNVIGASVALVLVLYFGMQSMSGVDVAVPQVSVPQVSTTAMEWIARVAGWFVTAGSLGFALMFTSVGRRLRSEVRQFL